MVRHIHTYNSYNTKDLLWGQKVFFPKFWRSVCAIYTHILTPSESFHLGSLQIEAFENFDCLKRLKIWLSYLNRKGNIKLFLISNWSFRLPKKNFFMHQRLWYQKNWNSKFCIRVQTSFSSFMLVLKPLCIYLLVL